MKNLTSPRYRATIELSRMDTLFIKIGAIKLSPGQWLSIGGSKCRFVRISNAGDLWVTHGTSQAQFKAACKAWLAK